MFKKIRNKMLLVFASIVTTFSIASPLAFVSLNSTNDITTNEFKSNLKNTIQNDLVFSGDNRKNQQETSVGIVSVFDKKVIMTSYFNHVIWEYDLSSSGSIVEKINNSNKSSIKDIKVKYNSFANTIIVYGRINLNASNQVETNFLFQLHEKTGNVYKVNQSNLDGSIIAGSQLTSNANDRTLKIFDMLINPNNGVITIFTENNSFINRENTEIKKINSITYDQFLVKFDGLSSNNFDYDASATMQSLFNINEKYWGFTYFYKGTGNSTDSYQYYVFDYNFKFIAKTTKTTISNGQSKDDKFKHVNLNETIAKPIVIPNSSNSSFYIVDASLIPTTNSTYVDDGVVGSNKFRLWKFNPNNSSSKFEDFNSNQINFTFGGNDYSIYSFKYDKNNKSIHSIIYQLKEEQGKYKVDFTKYSYQTWKLDENQNKIVVANKFSLTNADTNKKTIVNFGIINTKDVAENKTWIILQKEIYTNDANKTLESIDFKRGSYSLGSDSSILSPFDDQWKKIIINDYNNAPNSTPSKTKLPQDIPESEMLDWVKLYYKDNTNDEISDYNLKKSLETLSNENDYSLSDNQNVLFNDANGKLKIKIKVSFDKWWKSSEKENFQFDIDANGFGTTSGLSFQLVTSSTSDATKWAKIEKLKKAKKPSQITQDDIFNQFIIKGNSLSLTKDNIAISNTSSKEVNKSNLISVTTNDIKGSILIIYDLTSISSSSMSAENVIGKYEFTGFKNVTQYTAITLNETKFNDLKKNRLAYQFTIEDIVDCLDKSSIYNDMSKWVLTYTDAENSNEYYDNLISGKTGFTIKYTRDDNIPTEIPDDSLQVVVQKESNGSGCKKIEDVVGTEITYDENTLLSLSGNMNFSEVSDNIQTLLRKSINIKNNWFNVSTEIIPEYVENESNDKLAVYNLKYKDNKIVSKILITNNGNDFKPLEFNQTFREKITANSSTAKLFDLTKINVKYNLIEYKWNFGISNNDLIPQVSIKYLIEKINEDRLQQGQEPLSNDSIFPSVVSKEFEKNPLNFNKYFPLLQSVDQPISLKESSKNNEQHFDITEIQLAPNDSLGTLNVRYTINYPNLGSKEGIIEKPEIIIYDFKTTSVTTNNYLIISIIISIVIGLIILIVPGFLIFKRYKYLNGGGISKKNNLSKKIKDKVILNKDNIKEIEITNNSIDDIVSIENSIDSTIGDKTNNQNGIELKKQNIDPLQTELELSENKQEEFEKLNLKNTENKNSISYINQKDLDLKNESKDGIEIKEYKL